MTQEEPLELAFEVGGEEVLAEGLADFLHRPEAAAVELVLGGVDGGIVGGAVDIDQLGFALALKYILANELGCEVCDAQFFAHFAEECLPGCLAEVDVPADGCVPLAGLDVLPLRPLLQIYVATCVEDVQVDNGMQQVRAAVALAARCLSDYRSLSIDDGEQLLLIVFHRWFLWCKFR